MIGLFISVMAEKESYVRLTSIIDQIFDNVENLDIVKGADGDNSFFIFSAS